MNINDVYMTLKYNEELHTIFGRHNAIVAAMAGKEITEETIHFIFEQTMQEYHRQLSGIKTIKPCEESSKVSKKVFTERKKTVKKQAKRKAHLSDKQKLFYQSLKDRMLMARDDMIYHVIHSIGIDIFLADPSVYFSQDVMGKFFRNPFLRKGIIKHVQNLSWGCAA